MLLSHHLSQGPLRLPPALDFVFDLPNSMQPPNILMQLKKVLFGHLVLLADIFFLEKFQKADMKLAYVMDVLQIKSFERVEVHEIPLRGR